MSDARPLSRPVRNGNTFRPDVKAHSPGTTSSEQEGDGVSDFQIVLCTRCGHERWAGPSPVCGVCRKEIADDTTQGGTE